MAKRRKVVVPAVLDGVLAVSWQRPGRREPKGQSVPRCPRCRWPVKPGEATTRSRAGSVHHARCLPATSTRSGRPKPRAVCPSCQKPLREGEKTARARSGKTHHALCLASGKLAVAQVKAAARLAESRAVWEERTDELARESMRSHKPSAWRVGKSAGDFSRGSTRPLGPSR